MIKLPKEVVMQLVDELTCLLKDQESLEEINAIIEVNTQAEAEIDKRQEQIKALTQEIEELTGKILPVPTHKVVDEDRIEALSQMLVLSGYFKKVVGEDGEYLEETGAYEEDVQEEQPTLFELEEPVEETIEEPTVETTETIEPITVVEEV